MAPARVGRAAGIAVTVHGPSGAVDLMVPPGAVATDVAREYAAAAGLAAIPLLYTPAGRPLVANLALEDAGLRSGAVLVATAGVHRTGGGGAGAERRPTRDTAGMGVGVVVWCAVASAAAVLGGWVATRTPPGSLHDLTVAVLLAGALVGVLPVGRYSGPRAVAAPAFAAAATFALAWDPAPEQLPTVVGVTALGAAVGGAVARALQESAEPELRVWVVAGAVVFVLTALTTLLGLAPQATWSLLLLVAMLAARFVPAYAVEVPDQFLIDFERLAVTAWSARDTAPGRRGRAIVPGAAVAAVAARGARIVTAAGAAVLATVVVAAPLLLRSATVDVDRVGARCLVLLAGGSLVLAARSYRHPAARVLLRTAGLACWAALAVAMAPVVGSGVMVTVALAAVGLAVVLVVVAVATGRGWRSAWWSRRAEVSEAVCGAFAIASALVAAGLFRFLWELTS